ncbi:nicotinate-nucleotide--dimethylbenzimidazole phosphoribosyltransferase [Flavobacterium crassostreae]|uniref:Nicotinate-nucleotide--dimethylbenzimidazole phosphoribosyltransferase n=1 Tax=Flavobacterium crassostreae TaxID=1763534 RepID=A0A1B9E851_9FLAO|nr:nicotinate-nucleotide--dimethylbenzimidazole phosphoribosyltransferase [Flavobacterium crassostreae]OCB78109.1 5,6-dimethylbenzimidazole synthase [Flavobacterium crassostreae]
MTYLDEILKSRRDTRHFTKDPVPEEVIQKALQAGHWAPSVGLTDATKYYLIKSDSIKKAVKKLFVDFDQKAANQTDNESQKKAYKALKLEAIEEAPLGLVIGYDRSVLNHFTIGTVGSNEAIKFSSVCAAQNIWLSLTEQGYSMGWISILNYHQFKQLLGLPDHIEPLGYFCVGKPATNYGNQPMLQQLNWKQKTTAPFVQEINFANPINTATAKEPANRTTNSQTNCNTAISVALKAKIDHKTKPKGSLGFLEDIALQIGQIFQTTTPEIKKPHLIVFAADHGIAEHGVSTYSQDVTQQMLTNFLAGGAAINVFCNQHNIQLLVVDAGVNYDFGANSNLISAKIAKGTQSFLHGPAMSGTELDLCFAKGAAIVADVAKTESNCICFGEMGIGNTSTASVLMHILTKIPIKECVGKGTGASSEQLEHKIAILETAVQNYNKTDILEQQLAYFGGFEIFQIAGAMLEAYRHNMLIVVDGFICTVAYLIALKQNPLLKKNALFSHESAEQAHKKLLDYLDARAILQLDLRLGEGTGCAIAFPIIESALAFLNKMATFESANVNSK